VVEHSELQSKRSNPNTRWQLGDLPEASPILLKPRRRQFLHLPQVDSYCWTGSGICAYGGTQGALPTPKGPYAPKRYCFPNRVLTGVQCCNQTKVASEQQPVSKSRNILGSKTATEHRLSTLQPECIYPTTPRKTQNQGVHLQALKAAQTNTPCQLYANCRHDTMPTLKNGFGLPTFAKGSVPRC
jgi:hypothetical protein